MADLKLTDIRKSYGRTDIIHGIDLDIAHGEFVVLVGPSGCGKSTLLRMIAGLETITGGTLEIAGRVVNDLDSKDRDIAMVFQNYALYPHMTVAANMGFSLVHRGTDKAEIRRKVEWAAETLDLAKLLDRYPRQLSGGQRQRVAMGRAIVRDAKVFLFDEPLSNLDAKLRVTMRAEIRKLHARLKTTMIYVTHDQVEAMTMADKIVVLQGGRVEQVGSPMALYDRPANRFVAGFIGSPSMNFLEGRVTARGFETGGVVLPLATTAGLEGQEAVYGIRPEHFALASEGMPGTVEIEVGVTEMMGAEVQVIGTLAGQEVTVELRERVTPEPGSRLRLLPDLGQVHLFTRDGSARLN